MTNPSAPLDISPNRAKAILRWAKYLAFLEGGFTVAGAAWAMVNAGEALGYQFGGMILMLATGVLLLGLGSKVGEGNVSAAALLLLLAIARWAMVAMRPGGRGVALPLMILELSLFTLALFAAVSETRRAAPTSSVAGAADRVDSRVTGALSALSARWVAMWRAIGRWIAGLYRTVAAWDWLIKADLLVGLFLMLDGGASIAFVVKVASSPSAMGSVGLVLMLPLGFILLVLGAMMFFGAVASIRRAGRGQRVRLVARIVAIIVVVAFWEFLLVPVMLMRE